MDQEPDYRKMKAHLRGFTLMELLVVVAVIAILIAILAPALEKATERARLAACAENMHQLSVGLQTHATEFNNTLPMGPATPSSIDPTRNYNTVGSHQLWSGASGQYLGLGILATGSWLNDPRSLICPCDNDATARDGIRGLLGNASADAYGSYAYRQLDQTNSDRINVAGVNGAGLAARAIAFDWQSAGPAPYVRNSHDYNENFNILYLDGHVQGLPQSEDAMQVTADAYAAMPGSYLKKLDQLWVTADFAEGGKPSDAPRLP